MRLLRIGFIFLATLASNCLLGADIRLLSQLTSDSASDRRAASRALLKTSEISISDMPFLLEALASTKRDDIGKLEFLVSFITASQNIILSNDTQAIEMAPSSVKTRMLAVIKPLVRGTNERIKEYGYTLIGLYGTDRAAEDYLVHWAIEESNNKTMAFAVRGLGYSKMQTAEARNLVLKYLSSNDPFLVAEAADAAARASFMEALQPMLLNFDSPDSEIANVTFNALLKYGPALKPYSSQITALIRKLEPDNQFKERLQLLVDHFGSEY